MNLPSFRDATARDIPALRALNDPAVPEVSVIADQVWAAFVAGDALVRVAEDAGRLAALIVALPPGRGYASLHYAWFQRKLADFLYVDRIVIAPELRGRGLGRAAYADLFARTASDRPIVCEVNLDPPNDRSLAFHGSLGFREIAVAGLVPGKRVAMLARRPGAEAEPSLSGPEDGCTLETATPATAGDVAACVRALLAELGGPYRPDDAIAQRLIASGRVHAIIARDGGAIGGAITLAESESIYAGGRFGVIQELYVAPPLRSRGLGARLIAAARRVACSRGWNRLEVGAPSATRFARTRAFYLANAFVEIGPRLQFKLG